MINKKKQLSVFGKKLQICTKIPLTGFFRDGCCNSSGLDIGNHIICSKVTEEFLKFSLYKGNDLITKNSEVNFPGLVSGDKWCLCADRWLEALKDKCAPWVYLNSTNQNVLEKISLETLKRFALDLN